MTDRETPLAEIVGQMSFVTEYTDASTQSWVFISVNDSSVIILILCPRLLISSSFKRKTRRKASAKSRDCIEVNIQDANRKQTASYKSIDAWHAHAIVQLCCGCVS